MNRYLSPLYILIALTLAGLLYACHANAQTIPVHVYEGNGVTIHLLSQPCTDSASAALIAMALPPQLQANAKAIDSTWPHKDGSRHRYAGCWVELPKELTGSVDAFFLSFSDGNYVVAPKTEFTKAKGTTGV